MISIIAAMSENYVIGNNNSLLWHLSEDLKRFKQLTLNKVVIMGRKTYESIGKPLPHRTNIILTKKIDYLPSTSVQIINSTDEALNKFASEEVFIIGGGEIYKQFINLSDKMFITKIHKRFEGDALFPDFDYDLWNITSEVYNKGKDFDYSYIDFERKIL